MEDFLNAMRGQAARVAAQAAPTRIATVTSYDPDNYAVKVSRQPEDAETGWLPIVTPWAGNGWGMFAPPVVGSQVKLQHQEDGTETAICAGSFYSDEDVPVVPEIGSCPAGEWWLVHERLGRLRFLNDGTIEVQDQNKNRFRMLPDSTIETRHWLGSTMRFLPDTQVDVIHRDGSNIRLVPDSSVIVEHKGGSRIRLLSDGGIEAVHTSGSYVHLHTNGGIEIHQATGSHVNLLADGGIEIQQAGGSTISLKPDGHIDLQAGSIRASPDLNTVLPLVTSLFVALFNSHTHGSSSGPTPIMTEAHLTNAFRAR